MFLPRSLGRPRSGQLSERAREGGGGGKGKKVSKLLEPVSWKTVFTPPLSCLVLFLWPPLTLARSRKFGEQRESFSNNRVIAFISFESGKMRVLISGSIEACEYIVRVVGIML